MCPANQCRLIIFVSDFVLDFSTDLEQVLSKIQEIIQYVESRGHLITFSFLPYVPWYSKIQKQLKIPSLLRQIRLLTFSQSTINSKPSLFSIPSKLALTTNTLATIQGKLLTRVLTGKTTAQLWMLT